MFRGLEPCDHTTYLDTRLESGCHLAPLMQRPNSIMTCEQLARKLAALHPQATPVEIARQCLLILNTQPDPNLLTDEDQLKVAIRAANFRLDAAADQHSAMAVELEQLCQDGPVRFSADQIWILLRAVKVQSQLLELFTEAPALA